MLTDILFIVLNILNTYHKKIHHFDANFIFKFLNFSMASSRVIGLYLAFYFDSPEDHQQPLKITTLKFYQSTKDFSYRVSCEHAT